MEGEIIIRTMVANIKRNAGAATLRGSRRTSAEGEQQWRVPPLLVTTWRH